MQLVTKMRACLWLPYSAFERFIQTEFCETDAWPASADGIPTAVLSD
jgi:hypothetical protein